MQRREGQRPRAACPTQQRQQQRQAAGRTARQQNRCRCQLTVPNPGRSQRQEPPAGPASCTWAVPNAHVFRGWWQAASRACSVTGCCCRGPGGGYLAGLAAEGAAAPNSRVISRMAGLNMAGLILHCSREAIPGAEVSAQHGHNTRPVVVCCRRPHRRSPPPLQHMPGRDRPLCSPAAPKLCRALERCEQSSGDETAEAPAHPAQVPHPRTHPAGDRAARASGSPMNQ